MANVYNTIYKGEFCYKYGGDVIVEFKRRMPDTDTPPTPIEIQFAGENNSPVLIEWPTVDSYKLEPINGCECRISLKAIGDFELTDLYTADEKEWLVVVSGVKSFIGYLIPDQCIEPYASKPYDVQVSATDALATLKDIPFLAQDGSKIKGFISDIEILRTCLFYTGLGLDVAIGVNTYEDSMDTDACPLFQLWRDSARYFDQDDNPFSCYEVLRGVMAHWSARLRQHNGRWEIMNVMEQSAGAVKTWLFDLGTGSYLGNEMVGNAVTVGEQDRPVIPTNANVSLQKAFAASTAYYQIGRSANNQFNGDFNNAVVPGLPDGWEATSDAAGGSGVELDPVTGLPTEDKYLIITTSEADDAFIQSENPIFVEAGQTVKVSFNMRVPDVGTNTNTFVLDLLIKHDNNSHFLTERGWSNFGATYQIQFKGYKELIGVKTIEFDVPARFDDYNLVFGFKVVRTRTAGNEYTTHINNLVVSPSAQSERYTARVGEITRLTMKTAQSYRKEPITLLHSDDINVQVTSRLSVGQADPVIPTDLWSRAGYTEAKPLPYIVANSELTLHSRTYQIFEADFVGDNDIDPNTLLSVDLLSGTFIFLSGYYDMKRAVSRMRFAQVLPALSTDDFYELVKDDFGEEADGEGLVGKPVSPTPAPGGSIGGGNGEGSGGSGGTGTVTSVSSANSDIAVVDSTTTPVLTLNSGNAPGKIAKFSVFGANGVALLFDPGANSGIYVDYLTRIMEFNSGTASYGGYIWKTDGNVIQFKIDVNGVVTIRGLATGLTPPTPIGTTKMVIVDSSGQLSNADIPAGSETDLSLGLIDGNGITIDNSNGTGVTLPLTDYIANKAGLMSPGEKGKLNSIEANANNYTLPIASPTVLGGVKVGSGLAIDGSGLLSTSGGNVILEDSYATVDNVGGVITNLFSFVIPANTMVNNGDKICFSFIGNFQGSPNTQELLFELAPNNQIISSGTANGMFTVEGFIIKSGASTARIAINVNRNGAGFSTNYMAIPSIAWGFNQTLNLKADSSGSADISLYSGYLEFKPAAT